MIFKHITEKTSLVLKMEKKVCQACEKGQKAIYLFL